jgi:hypothetical protein
VRFVFGLVFAITIALVSGFGSAWYALENGELFVTLSLGPWKAWPAAGTAEADPYTHAYLARSGQLQLGRAEGIRFASSTDSAGLPLKRECRYRIEGETPVASLWTLYAEDEKGALIGHGERRDVIDGVNLPRGNDGRMLVRTGPAPAGPVWLATPGRGPVQFVLTLYDTSLFAGLSAESTPLPEIREEGCA